MLESSLPPRFRGGQLIPLIGGMTNQSYRLQLESGRYFLRVGTPMAARVGIKRRHEMALHLQASRAGLAPALHFMDVERGLMITDWVTGAEQTADWHTTAGLQRLAAVLHQVHTLPVPSCHLDLSAHLYFYLARICLRDGLLTQAFARAQQLLAALPPAPAVFCHNDVSPLNLFGAPLQLVDWEYAGAGDAAFDLACACHAFALDGGQQMQLLTAYQAKGGVCSGERLDVMRQVADVVALLWARVFAENTGLAHYDTLYQQQRQRCQEWLS